MRPLRQHLIPLRLALLPLGATLSNTAKQLGDVAVVLSCGWEIVCVQSGGPILFEHGDECTLGYADPTSKKIAIAVQEATELTVANEAAHAFNYEQLKQRIKNAVAEYYSQDYWDEGSDFWNTSAEMFAEGRASCLRYGADSDFAIMSCEKIDELINNADQANLIVAQVQAAD